MNKQFSQQRPQKNNQGQGGSSGAQESQNQDGEEYMDDEDVSSRAKSERTRNDDQSARQKNTDT